MSDFKVLNCKFISQGCGTAKYSCKWEGKPETQELVNYCDGGSYNYGGRIDNKYQNSDGTYSGTVCVYYD